MTIKTTAAVLAALTFLATPITAQAQGGQTVLLGPNSSVQNLERRDFVAVDLSALKAGCTSNSASSCMLATTTALDTYNKQGPEPSQINAQIGLIAAMLVETYNADNDLWPISDAVYAMIAYSNDQLQRIALLKISERMTKRLPLPLDANAFALSPN